MRTGCHVQNFKFAQDVTRAHALMNKLPGNDMLTFRVQLRSNVRSGLTHLCVPGSVPPRACV